MKLTFPSFNFFLFYSDEESGRNFGKSRAKAISHYLPGQSG